MATGLKRVHLTGGLYYTGDGDLAALELRKSSMRRREVRISRSFCKQRRVWDDGWPDGSDDAPGMVTTSSPHGRDVEIMVSRAHV